MDYTENGRVQSRNGNRHPAAAPHGAFRCRGEDRWCAIAVFTDEEWQAFCQVLGEPPWTKDTRFATLKGRKENEDELERLVEEWTVNYPAEQVMALMQAAGVAAGVVANGQDLLEDPQLNHRQHWQRRKHAEIGEHVCDAYSFRLSKTPAHYEMAPLLGEHNDYVFRELLNLSEEEYVALLLEGIFE
jgi:benzylsuccinate CoA-transferase BbsF subunit